MLNDRETIRIVILSDQKPGHYNQSLGVVENIGNCQYNIINVTFRGKSHDNLLRVATCIFGKYLLPRKIIQLCLKATLSINTLSEINSIEHVDIILSTGSSVAAINLLLGQLFNAQTVTCRNPSPIGTDFFDLAILPQTSRPKRKKSNLCHTIGGPNRISPKKLKKQAEILRQNINISSSTTIGLLIGGGDRYHTISPQTITDLLYILSKLSQELDLKILLATSRRTPPVINNLIAKDILDTPIFPICVLVLARWRGLSHLLGSSQRSKVWLWNPGCIVLRPLGSLDSSWRSLRDRWFSGRMHECVCLRTSPSSPSRVVHPRHRFCWCGATLWR